MVEPDDVHQGECGLDTLNPPGIAILRHQVPAIERVAPELAGGAEVVRRHTGSQRRLAAFVEIEQLGMQPHCSAIECNEYGHVAEKPDAAVVAILLEPGPLFEKLVLLVFVPRDFACQLLAPALDSCGTPQFYVILPHIPGLKTMGFFQGRIKRIAVEPRGFVTAEGVEPGSLSRRGFLLEGLERLLQQRELEGADCVEVNRMLRERGRVGQVGGFQQAFLKQLFQAYEQGIACEDRVALVGGVAVANGTQGQHLPETLFGVRQEVGEAIGLGPQVAAAEAAGEGGGMKEDAA